MERFHIWSVTIDDSHMMNEDGVAHTELYPTRNRLIEEVVEVVVLRYGEAWRELLKWGKIEYLGSVDVQV